MKDECVLTETVILLRYPLLLIGGWLGGGVIVGVEVNRSMNELGSKGGGASGLKNPAA